MVSLLLFGARTKRKEGEGGREGTRKKKGKKEEKQKSRGERGISGGLRGGDTPTEEPGESLAPGSRS